MKRRRRGGGEGGGAAAGNIKLSGLGEAAPGGQRKLLAVCVLKRENKGVDNVSTLLPAKRRVVSQAVWPVPENPTPSSSEVQGVFYKSKRLTSTHRQLNEHISDATQGS